MRAPASRPVQLVLLALALTAFDADARTVHRCERDGTVSISTAPEPGSTCKAIELDDNDPNPPNPWGALGTVSGTLYAREQDGRTVYGTRKLPGAREVLGFTVRTPPGAQAHEGLGTLGPPRLDAYAEEFRASARATGVDDAWLRAIAHAESGFDPAATSHKGAMGIMQLMPATAAEYGVSDPYAHAQSIRGGAELLGRLMQRYGGNLSLVAAAYNAGMGTIDRYGGIPPYAETRAYVAKVLALHQRYQEALAMEAKPAGRGVLN